MYNFIELFADCAEQIASVATSTIDASAVEKRTNESVSPKMYNFNPEKGVTIDVVPPVEKYRDTRPMDVDSKYTLTEKNIVFISDSKDSVNNFYTHDRINDITTGQKSCVHTYDSDQVSSTMYSDILQNSIQKQQNVSSESKDSDRYDKKLNQPNFKPSISNVFNSLNEYINAPSGSLNYVEPILDRIDDLPKRSVDDIVENNFRSNRDVAINERSVPIEKDVMNVVDKNVLDHKNVLPVELGTFVKTETSNKQDNIMQNVMFYHSTPIQSEENTSETIIPVSNTAIARHNNAMIDITLSSNKDDVDKKVMISDTFKENSDSIISKQMQLDLDTRDSVDKYKTFIENKESIAESTVKLNKTIMSSQNHDKNVETISKSDVFSNIPMTHTIDTNDDFSEEELNQYLLELEKEESSKTESMPLSDNVWLSQSQDELRGDREKSASHCQRNDEDVNEAPIFEKIMIGELPKISQEEFQEKTKKFPVIDYNADICNENITDVKCNTVKVTSNENSNQLKDVQNNELDKTIKDTHVIEAVQDIATQENILPSITVQEKITSKFESIGEQLCSNNMTQKLQQDSNRDTQSQDNSSSTLLNLSENKEDHDKRVYCQDITENNKDIVYESAQDSEEISKIETVSKISACMMVPHTKENDQEAEKPTRPQTLDIVLTHNKNDSHSGMSLSCFIFLISFVNYTSPLTNIYCHYVICQNL